MKASVAGATALALGSLSLLAGCRESTQADSYQIIAGGFGIQARMDIPFFSFSDQIRVLTRCECDGEVCGAD